MSGIDMIADERARQVKVEGWTPEHDDEIASGELAMAAACYAAGRPIKALIAREIPCGCREACCEHIGGTILQHPKWQDPWPWEGSSDKRKKHDRLKSLVIAGALIAAEIDRILRERGSDNG